MTFSDKNAAALFPRTLQILESITPLNDLLDYFKSKLKSIPPWLFLKWIPQILSMYSTRVKDFVEETLLVIGKEYPNAVFFALRGQESKFEGTRLDVFLNRPLLRTFTHELMRLTEPAHLVKDFLGIMLVRFTTVIE